MPAFKSAGANMVTVVTSDGVSATHHGRKNGFENASTDYPAAILSKADSVVIATQHNLHASQVIEALTADKHVFVEKPLALSHDEINSIEEAYRISDGMLMVDTIVVLLPKFKNEASAASKT